MEGTQTAIIPLRNHDDGRQLVYALRSICKHHPEITRCILVGGKPHWYTGDHLPHTDYLSNRKEQNIRDKVAAACRTLHVGSFLFANDDHILLAPMTQVWDKGPWSSMIRNIRSDYGRLQHNTLGRYGDVPNADTHCPLWMNAAGVERTMFEWPEYGYGFKTAYCQENGIASVTMEDCKVASGVPDRPWFSLTDSYRVKQLEKIFPDACKFEKGFVS